MKSSSDVHPYQPHELETGHWQVHNLITPTPCTRVTALLFIGKHFYDVPEAMEYAFWEFAKAVWQLDPDDIILEKQEWSEQIIHDLAHNKYVAFGGSGSSGKSHVCAAWVWYRWLCDPKNTIALITTTALKDADQRVWGSMIRLADPLKGVGPFKERPSLHDFVLKEDAEQMNISRGMFLVAAEKKKTREAVGRFVGRKAKHILLLADELGELSPAIMNAGISNLSLGGELTFQAIGCSNPDSRFDAFGEWSEPADGWDSVDTENDTTWRTRWGGVYRRFDAYESPHFNRVKSYLPTETKIDEARELLGEKSRAFLRMWRAIFFNGSEESGVYTEVELSKSGALRPVTQSPIKQLIGRVAGVDLGFTWGGDRTMWRAADIGYADDGRLVTVLHPLVTIKEDIGSGEPRAYQIANGVVDLMKKYKVPARHVAVDATAGGAPICDVIDTACRDAPSHIAGQVTRVSFGGSPTDTRPNPRVKRTAKEMYRNRVTELWFACKELFRCQQIFGLDGETAKEMTLREYDQKKAATGLRVQLESKAEYKGRTNLPSPDAADTTFLALDSARMNFSLMPIDPRKESDPKEWRQAPRALSQADAAGLAATTHL